jgi:hypothetical protein
MNARDSQIRQLLPASADNNDGGRFSMANWIPPEVIEKIKKKEEEVHRDNRIPLYLPDEIPTHRDPNQEPEETSSIIIIDLVD